MLLNRGDSRNKIVEYFKKVGDGLAAMKNKLNRLSNEIFGVKNVDGITIKVVEDAIRGVSEVFEKLIGVLIKLTGATGNTFIGDVANNNAVGIKNAIAVIANNVVPVANFKVGVLATIGNGDNFNGIARTNAVLASAVVLKIMKNGKFAQGAANEEGAVKAAAVNAVNKVLRILDIMIGKIVASILDKIRGAVKGIKYFETSGIESSQSDTIQSVVTK